MKGDATSKIKGFSEKTRHKKGLRGCHFIYSCPICGKEGFRSQRSVKDHIYEVHAFPPLGRPCEGCE